MTNREKYAKEILDIACKKESIAMQNGKLRTCYRFNCTECDWDCDRTGRSCRITCKAWCDAEYKDPEIDWSKVPIDTKVLTSINRDDWYKRYYAGYHNGEKCVFHAGRTSWSARSEDDTKHFLYIKLAEEPRPEWLK